MLRLIVVSCVLLIATSCSSGSEDRGTASPSTRSQTTPKPTAAATSDPLEGRWTTDTITPRMVKQHLNDAGLGKAVRTVVDDQGYPTALNLTLAAGKYQLADADGAVLDVGSYEVQDNRITLVAAATGVGPTFTWDLDGDELNLDFVSSTGTPYKGQPDEAFARPIYDVPTFTRDG